MHHTERLEVVIYRVADENGLGVDESVEGGSDGIEVQYGFGFIFGGFDA